MLVLVVGAKGGVGTTSVALHLIRASKGIGLDLADGMLAGRLERTAWTLGRPVFATAGRKRKAVETVIQRRITLLWTPECLLAGDAVWDFVGAVADRAVVVVDGGLEPPEEIDRLVDVRIIVSTETDVAQWHARRLKERFPDAAVAIVDLAQSRSATKEAAQELAAQIF